MSQFGMIEEPVIARFTIGSGISAWDGKPKSLNVRPQSAIKRKFIGTLHPVDGIGKPVTIRSG